MKTALPLFAVALAAATLVPGIDAQATTCFASCTDSSCVSAPIATGGGSTTITVPSGTAACPFGQKRYISALKVSEDAGLGIVVTFQNGVSGAVITPDPADKQLDSAGTPLKYCYYTYTNVGGPTGTLTADVIATVKCQNENAPCNIKYQASFTCAPTGATCSGDTSAYDGDAALSATSATGVEVTGASAGCTGGSIAYLKWLDVRSVADKAVVVTFNNLPAPQPLVTGDTCAYYKDVIDLKPTTTPISATIKCVSTTEGETCSAKYKAEWGCYKAPVASETYTRKTLTGAACAKDVTDCANRCAKSYQLGMLGTDKLFVPQYTAGCSCSPLTAAPHATNPTAANTVTGMNVAFVTTSDPPTMTITYTGKDCTATYSKVAFANAFVPKTYARASVAAATGTDAADCEPPSTATPAAICAYKCATQFALVKGTDALLDTITATQVAVIGCTCASTVGTAISAVVDGDGVSAAGSTSISKYYGFVQAGTDVNVKTTTKIQGIPASGATPAVAAKTTECNAVYKESCATVCPAADCTAMSIAATGTELVNPTPCKYGYSYLSALTVGTDVAAGAVDVQFGGAVVASSTSVNTCYKTYGAIGSASVTAETKPVIFCTGANNAKVACSVKVKPTWACTPPVCPKTCPTGCTDLGPTTAGSPTVTIPKPSGWTQCPAGQYASLRSLKVTGKNGKDIVVTFNQGLDPKPTDSGGACYYTYANVVGDRFFSTDVVATVTCKDGPGCTISYAAEWGCYTPPTVDIYSRIKTGDNCVTDLTDCANRCAKSYQVTTKTTTPSTGKTTTMAFKALVKGDCDCTAYEFEIPASASSSAGASAASADGKWSVQVTEAGDFTTTMTVGMTNADNNVCTWTYSRMPFTYKFLDKAYSRTDPDTTQQCQLAAEPTTEDLCAYNCAAELALNKTAADTFRATPATVAGCDCGAPIDLVVDGDGASAAVTGNAVKYSYDKDTTVLKVTTTAGTAEQPVPCTAGYKESCPKLCSDGACGTYVADAASADNGLKLTNLDGCPAYTVSYPKSLIVRGRLAENEVSVLWNSNAPKLAADAGTDKCYKKYGPIGYSTDGKTPPSSNVEPIVSCKAGGKCTVAAKTEWGCTPVSCPSIPVDFPAAKTLTVPDATGVVVAVPDTSKCTTPMKAYIKSLDIRLPSKKDVVVKFNNGLNPVPISKGDACMFYSNVMGVTAAATADVNATINCTSATAGDKCDVRFKAEWGCYTPAAVPVYTRKGAPEGRGCVTDLSTCASRCAKSYQLIKTEKEKMLVPQITPDGCYCPALTATTDTSDPPVITKATNPTTKMEVNEVTASNTLTVEYTAPGKECKTTFAKAAFANSFVAETYARGAVTPATCVPAADADADTTCAFKCAAELSIKPLGVDALNVTQAVVTSPADCTCDPFMAYVDVDGLTAVGSTKLSSVEIKQTAGSLTVKTTTGSAVCTASYSKKTAPPPPATASPTTTAPTPTTTTKTGTSAGVSALGAGADAGMVTVTLVAAAAGVQAVGLPA